HVDGLHHHLQRIAPGGFTPFAVFSTDHGVCQAVFGVKAIVRKAVAVADPALVDVFVLEGNHALDAIELDLGNEVGAQTVVRADRTTAGQLPGTGRHLVGTRQQRAHRAEVDHVAGEFGFNRLADEGGDLGKLAPVHHADFHHAADLFAETHTTGAVNATLHAFGGNERAHALGHDHALRFLVAGGRLAVTDRQVLQLALTALVADRAVERVIDEQELHDGVLCRDSLLGACVHDHAVGDGRGTGRQGLGRLFYVDQAHAAVGCHGKLLVIAKMRNVDAELVGSLDDHAPFGCFRLDAVDGDFNH